ncbi:MAG TPA: hypothetical protein VD813_07360, partial [Pseudonocardia sp.]|nr:hypothetical protein [Pseudonocardia sp.]
MTAQPSPPVDTPVSARHVESSPAPVTARPSLRRRLGEPPRGPLLMGLAASVLMVLGGFGAGGVLVRDPLLT